MHLLIPKWFPLFILASSVCKSLQCLISTLTQRGEGGHLFRLTCSIVLRGGRNTANKYQWCVWGVLAVSGPGCICHHSWRVCFLVYTAQAPDCSAGELSKVGPGLLAIPRSKLLRFRFLGTPQRHRLCWACVLCALFVPFPGQSSSGNQVLGERTLPRCGASYHLPSPSCSVSWVVYCVSLLGS